MRNPTSRGNILVDKGDDALRFVGTVELWKNIIVALLFAIAGIVGAVALARYHSGWTSGEFAVTKATCDPPTKRTSCHKDDCTTKEVVQCTAIDVQGFATPFVAQYTEPTKPPAVGAKVKVFYDPADKSQAFLAHDDWVDEYKGWLIGFLVLMVLGLGFSAWFQYYVRGSHLAQRVAGGAAVLQMVT